MTKSSARITFPNFGWQVPEFSYSRAKAAQTEHPSLDGQAQELARELGLVASKCNMPLQLTPPGVREHLLARVRASDIYAAVSEFSATQWQLLCDGLIANGADCLFIATDQAPPDYNATGLPRSVVSVAQWPLKVLEEIAKLHPGGFALWLMWYRDSKAEDFPIAIASNSEGEMAGWVVAPGGSWWPLAELKTAVEYLIEWHHGHKPAEQELVDEHVAHIKEDMGPETILGPQNEAFMGTLEWCSAAQHDLLQNCLAQSQRIALQQRRIEEMERALANVTGELRARG